jgi:two-component system nitrate/nitrite response regulator NarL
MHDTAYNFSGSVKSTGEMMEKVNLLISDSNRLFREGLSRILASRRMVIAGEARSLNEVLEMLRSSDIQCDLLLCDPGDSEQELMALHGIKQEFPAVRTVLLTHRITPSSLETAIEGGAAAFLPKDISADALRYSLEIVLLGEQIFPTVHSLLEPRPAAVSPTELPMMTSRQVPLSTRERQILACLVNGQPNKTIARNLNMAEATVKVHLKALLRKINAQNRTQAAIWGMNHGLPVASAASAGSAMAMSSLA